MITGFIETVAGLMLFNSSIKGLKNSVVRKWREGFTLALITSVIAVLHGLLWTVVNLPELLNLIIVLVMFLMLTIALLRISKMRGLKA